MKIEGVPDTISRADYARLIESVGLNPTLIRSLEFRPDGVYGKVAVQMPDGALMVDDDKVVEHRVFIRVVD
jgi:hypothetical protein